MAAVERLTRTGDTEDPPVWNRTGRTLSPTIITEIGFVRPSLRATHHATRMCGMHRPIALCFIAACVFLAACDDNPTTAPSATPVVFSAALQPANEVPPVAGSESSGHGAMQVQFDLTRDAAGNITGATGTFYVQLTGYPPGTTIVGAHIHPGVAGINGSVIISTGLATANTRALDNGSGEFTFRGVLADPAVVQQIINNPSAFYFNVHSPSNPGGFSRGQLARVQ
jgi:hypothetical protein